MDIQSAQQRPLLERFGRISFPSLQLPSYLRENWCYATSLFLKTVTMGTALGTTTYVAIHYGVFPKPHLNPQLLCTLVGIASGICAASTVLVRTCVNRKCTKRVFTQETLQEAEEAKSFCVKLREFVTPSYKVLFTSIALGIGTLTILFVYTPAQAGHLAKSSLNAAQLASVAGLTTFVVSLGGMTIYHVTASTVCCSSKRMESLRKWLRAITITGVVGFTGGISYYVFGRSASASNAMHDGLTALMAVFSGLIPLAFFTWKAVFDLADLRARKAIPI